MDAKFIPFTEIPYTNQIILIKFRRNYYPQIATYQNVEPIAGNYYPIDSRIIISNGTTTLAVLNDRSNGGSSINDGQMEIMVPLFILLICYLYFLLASSPAFLLGQYRSA